MIDRSNNARDPFGDPFDTTYLGILSLEDRRRCSIPL
jgi:hypothetical protein